MIRHALAVVPITVCLSFHAAFLFAEPIASATTVKRPRATSPVVLDGQIAPADVEKRPYCDYVASCLGSLMQYGTDRYGDVHQPTLVPMLDVRDKRRPESPGESPTRWRSFGRFDGCEPLSDQPLVEVFHLLSQRTGDSKYIRFADSYMRCVTNLRCDKDLFWWGTHRHYDPYKDERISTKGNHHEINLPCARWEYLWQVNPEATRAAIEAIWQWHVVNKETGEHNRHADGKRGRAFPISGGAFVHAFAFLHSKTKEPEHLEWARRVADHHWQHRDSTTNLLPGQTGTGRDRFDGWHSDTSVTGIYCYYLLKSHELTGDTTFRDQALAYLTAYARHGYDPESGKFFGSLRLDGTPEPGPRARNGYERSEVRGFIDLWEPMQLAYEYPIYTAQAYAYAYQATGDRLMLETAERWADWIRRDPPSSGCLITPSQYADYARRYSRHGTYADKYGRTVSLFVHLYALTGQRSYLDDARELAREAVSKLYHDGLFRGHPASDYYSTLDGVGFLLRALVQLDAALDNPRSIIGAKTIPLNDRGDQIGFDNW